ncbi:TPA: DUF551 domain-containing protein [Serratia marcescens]|nr:DUF551 domain-containing protein [Serratia marcescens]
MCVYGNTHPCYLAAAECLANREAQPVGFYTTVSGRKGVIWHNGAPEDDTAIYTAPPAPAVNAAPDFEVWFNSPEAGLRVVNYHIQHELQLKAWNACRAAMLENIYKPALQLDSVVTRHSDQPVSSGYTFNSPVIPDGWIACSERMPEVGERDWRTALPVLVKCEIGVIPAYYGFTYHEGEQCFGFMESIKFGDASGSGPEQHENRLMMHVTHWMPLPAEPEVNKHD